MTTAPPTDTATDREAGQLPTLTAMDRCDQCGARAFAVAWFPTGTGPAHSVDRASELLFCGHHFREHRERIDQSAVRVLDETRFILEFAASGEV